MRHQVRRRADRYPTRMGLTVSQRKAVTKAMAARYRSASKTEEQAMLTELCALTGLAS